MRRRDFLTTTTALAGAAGIGFGPGAARAQGEPVRGGTLIWGHSETTQNLDMHQTGTASTGRLLQNVHDAIVTVDENFQVIPSLAESFEVSEDGLTYTFRLRPGVMFHDGSTLTSADVKYSFDRCRDPETGAVNFEVFNDVASIETPDDLTVVISMNQVNAPFLSRLAENGAGVVMPEGSGDIQGTTPTGCGPFRFVRREFGNEVELVRFDEYWGGPAWLDGVLSREVTEPTVRLTGLETGEFHLINDIPLDRVDALKSDPDLKVLTWFPLSWAFLNMNHDRAPFDNKLVREALDHMIDKEVLVQGAIWGQGVVTASPSFPSSPTYNDALSARPQDFERARALLAEAGFGPGELSFTFKVTTNYPWHVEATQILVEWFRQGGVDASIQQLSWSDWLSQCWVDRDYDVTMMNFFTLWEPDFLYYSLWNSEGAFNYRQIRDPELDEMTAAARRVVDPAERAQIYKDIQKRVQDETHDVVLWFRNGTVGARPEVGGLDQLVHPNGSNLQFKNVWLTG
ncbi:MAG: ABC transporter substrate-binding protein [Pseudomonadota bacterium]